MKKIAVLNCLNSNRVCAGAACLSAFNRKTASFGRYRGEEVELAAFMRCNGCESVPKEDEGILEKVERLKKEGVEAVHVGVCTKNREGIRCKKMEVIMDMIKDQGIELVDGTHR